MTSERDIAGSLRRAETLAEYGRRLARADREDDYTPVCAADGCVFLATAGAWCALHGDETEER